MTEAKEDTAKEALAERLKFFFSDPNVRSDNFMRNKLLKSEGGFVPIEILLRFNSVKCHTTEPKVVVEVAKTLSDTLVLNEAEDAIGRVDKFTMDRMDDNIPLSLYVSNLPMEEAKEGDESSKAKFKITVDEFRKPFEELGTVTYTKLRFKPEKKDGNSDDAPHGKKKWVPAGSGFVEFETKEQLKAAAEETCTVKDGEDVEPKKSIELGGNKVKVITMQEWLDSKKKGKKEGDKDDSGKDKKSPSKRSRDGDSGESKPSKELFNVDWKPRCVISIKGLPEDCDRESLREMVGKHMGIADEDLTKKGFYADFSRGQTNGAIRFNDPCDEIEQIATKLSKGELEINGAKVESANVLEGEEETKYWTNFIEFKRKQIKQRAEEGPRNRNKRFRRN